MPDNQIKERKRKQRNANLFPDTESFFLLFMGY